MQSDCFGALPPREQDPAWKLQRPGQSRAQQIEAHEAEWIAKKVLCSVYRHRRVGVLFATGRPLKRAELAYLLLLSGSLGRRWPYPPSRSCPAASPTSKQSTGVNPSQSLSIPYDPCLALWGHAQPLVAGWTPPIPAFAGSTTPLSSRIAHALTALTPSHRNA